ncbi:MAG: glycoside hydrolase family 3 C-terminal domain-containing protein [Halieaceae bacterium]|nr:glycoside hydrolase family 3 C-terminal domain-containing protein [Halieaceae bacterium]
MTELDTRVRSLLRAMTVDEKLSLLAGNSLFKTKGVSRLGLTPMKLTDGPRGIGFHSSLRRCTAFPTGISLAASWDPELGREFGEALALEARSVGAQVVLGPAVNICRTPLNGRTFEYLSEDPELNSRLAVEVIKGIQSKGVAACIKHYAANNQETNRIRNSSRVSERALREIYLPTFEAAVREADVWSVMAAYNAVNGVAACEHKQLLTDVLRNEYGFTGFVVSDWFAVRRTSSAASCLKAGLNLEMPGRGSRYRLSRLKKEYDAGAFTLQELDDSLRDLLRVWLRTNPEAGHPTGRRNSPGHQQLARRMAAQGITLLKNDGALLPLDIAGIRRLAVVGPRAEKRSCRPLYGGSAGVWSPYEITPVQGLREMVGSACEIVSDPAGADAVLVFVGLGHRLGGDSEAGDRKNMALPPDQDALVRDTLAKNPNTVVVLVTGSPVEMPWVDDVPAIVMAWYPGMEGGRAIADVLFGRVNPGGKLPVTFPRTIADSPAHGDPRCFPGDREEVCYDEDIFVGYRHFDRVALEPLFPFGHGLSYTRFEYSELTIEEDDWQHGGPLRLSMRLTNSGRRDGAEVVQLYVGPPAAPVPRPVRELKAFCKVFLSAGESRSVAFELPARALAYYCPESLRWRTEDGEYEISIGSSSRDLRLRVAVDYAG